jgi:hypothetical protein
MYLKKKKYISDFVRVFPKIRLVQYLPTNLPFQSSQIQSIKHCSIKNALFRERPISFKKRQRKNDQNCFTVKFSYQPLNFYFDYVKNKRLGFLNFFNYKDLVICFKQIVKQNLKILNYSFQSLSFDYVEREIMKLRIQENSKKKKTENFVLQSTNLLSLKYDTLSRTLLMFLTKNFFIKETQALKLLNFNYLKPNFYLKEKKRMEHHFFDFYIKLIQKKLQCQYVGQSWKRVEELTLKLGWIWLSEQFALISIFFFKSLKPPIQNNLNEKIKNKKLDFYKLKQQVRCFWNFSFKMIFFHAEVPFQISSIIYNFPFQSFINLLKIKSDFQTIQILFKLLSLLSINEYKKLGTEQAKFTNDNYLTFSKHYGTFVTKLKTKKTVFNKTSFANKFDFLAIRLLNIFEIKQQKFDCFWLTKQIQKIKVDSNSIYKFFKSNSEICISYKSLFDFLKKYSISKLKKDLTSENKVKSKETKIIKQSCFNAYIRFFQIIGKNTGLKQPFENLRNRSKKNFSMNVFERLDQNVNFIKSGNKQKNIELIRNYAKLINEWDFLNLRLFNFGLIEIMEEFSFFDLDLLSSVSLMLNLYKIEEKVYSYNFLSIRKQLLNIKITLKTVSTKTQLDVIKKLTPKFYAWSYYHRFSIFFTLKNSADIDSKITHLLWRWSLRRHNNKSKYWIRTKYFYCFNQKKWVFGNFSIIKKNFKTTQKLIYLPSHFQILFFLKRHRFITIANFKNAF